MFAIKNLPLEQRNDRGKDNDNSDGPQAQKKSSYDQKKVKKKLKQNSWDQ